MVSKKSSTLGKRVVKTMKSMVPKKLDLTMLVAVVLAGLLVCYLFKKSRAIEGFTTLTVGGTDVDSADGFYCDNSGTLSEVREGTSTDMDGDGNSVVVGDLGCESGNPTAKLDDGEPCTDESSGLMCTSGSCVANGNDGFICAPAGSLVCGGAVCTDASAGASCTDGGACPDPGSELIQGDTDFPWPVDGNNFNGIEIATAAQCANVVNSDPGVTCSDITEEDECGSGSNGTLVSQMNCYWKDCSEIDSITGSLEGVYFQSWMDDCLFQQPPGTVESAAKDDEWVKNTILPLKASYGDESPELDNAISNDILAVLELIDNVDDTENADVKANVTQIKQNIEGSAKIPEKYKEYVINEVDNCAKGWLDNESTRAAYAERAGGRPIMGYNSKDGFKCRNPLFTTYDVPTSASRLIFSSEICGKDQCPCEMPTSCQWDARLKDNDVGFFGRVLDGLSHSVGGNNSWCRVPACRAAHSGLKCAPSFAYDTASDAVSKSFQALPSIGGGVGQCGA